MKSSVIILPRQDGYEWRAPTTELPWPPEFGQTYSLRATGPWMLWKDGHLATEDEIAVYCQ